MKFFLKRPKLVKFACKIGGQHCSAKRDLKLPIYDGTETVPLELARSGRKEAMQGGRDVLLVDIVLDSGVTQDFVLRRLGEGKPRSLRLAVLLDKISQRKGDLEPDYFGFRTASNEVWVGYGLAAANGTGRNLRQLSSGANGMPRKSVKGRKK